MIAPPRWCESDGPAPRSLHDFRRTPPMFPGLIDDRRRDDEPELLVPSPFREGQQIRLGLRPIRVRRVDEHVHVEIQLHDKCKEMNTWFTAAPRRASRTSRNRSPRCPRPMRDAHHGDCGRKLGHFTRGVNRKQQDRRRGASSRRSTRPISAANARLCATRSSALGKKVQEIRVPRGGCWCRADVRRYRPLQVLATPRRDLLITMSRLGLTSHGSQEWCVRRCAWCSSRSRQRRRPGACQR